MKAFEQSVLSADEAVTELIPESCVGRLRMKNKGLGPAAVLPLTNSVWDVYHSGY